MKRIAVFCGSGEGTESIYKEHAYTVGKTLAEQGIEVIYGGAKIGLMGAVADGALQHGGIVRGVIPTFLRTKEVAHTTLTELIVTETMHERKLKMHELSEGIITLPGGWGTMEELFEMLTWGQLGLHPKPIGLLNTNGYYDSLIALNETMIQKGFLKSTYSSMLITSASIDGLLSQMRAYIAPVRPVWMTEQTT
ncbi:MAG: TIGR00730 family Rossman fold protein [Bacteroidota bacterium]